PNLASPRLPLGPGALLDVLALSSVSSNSSGRCCDLSPVLVPNHYVVVGRKRLLCRQKRQKQSSGLVHDRAQTVPPVERHDLIVFGVNEQSKGGRCILNCPVSGVDRHQLAEAAALKALIDG